MPKPWFWAVLRATPILIKTVKSAQGLPQRTPFWLKIAISRIGRNAYKINEKPYFCVPETSKKWIKSRPRSSTPSLFWRSKCSILGLVRKLIFHWYYKHLSVLRHLKFQKIWSYFFSFLDQFLVSFWCLCDHACKVILASFWALKKNDQEEKNLIKAC